MSLFVLGKHLDRSGTTESESRCIDKDIDIDRYRYRHGYRGRYRYRYISAKPFDVHNNIWKFQLLQIFEQYMVLSVVLIIAILVGM